MTEETLALLVELRKCAQDPAAFARLRRQVLASHFASLPTARQARLHAFQEQIEATSAVAGTPGRAVNVLLDDLLDQFAALEACSRRARGEEPRV